MPPVDELFKKPEAPLAASKRKFEGPNVQEVYKVTKLSNGSSPHANGASVEDAAGDDDGLEAGPQLPPDDDDGDDEDGRFFGSGVTRNAAEALDYINEQDGEPFREEKIDSAWLRRLANTFEKKVSKNAQLRAKFESQPEKFMESEADLDAEVKNWSMLSEHPELYSEFAASASLASLVGLLAHENTDIAIGAIEILSELLDEDVEAEQEQVDALVSALLDADLMDLLMSNLKRLDEGNESDRSGVYYSLSVIENLASQTSIAEKIGTPTLLLYLCNRIKASEIPIGQNKQYAAEVLQVLLQSSSMLRKCLASEEIDGIDLFLQLLASYRKCNPQKDTSEEEYVENLFDALTCVVDEPEGKSKFLDGEGVELMLIMLREGTKNISQRSLRVLDHATNGQGPASARVCERIVEAAGLKTVFSLFMKSKDARSLEHLLGIFSAMLRMLPGESAARIRTIAKLTEKKYEKVTKLIQLHSHYARKVAVVDREIKLEQQAFRDNEIEGRESEWFSRRLDGGLFCLQMTDVVLAWLVAEDGEVRKKVQVELEGGLAVVKQSLEEQKRGLDGVTEEDEDTGEMLETLIGELTR